MKTFPCCANHRASLRFPLPALAAAALGCIGSVVGAELAPPAFPDIRHVPNGCFISATAYVDRFLRAFPEERATTLTVRPASFDGPHTVVLLTWAQTWWVRDEYSGVVPLECDAGASVAVEALRDRAEVALDRAAARDLRGGRIDTASPSDRRRTTVQRQSDVLAAAALLPCPSTVVSVPSRAGAIPFLYFEPSPGRVAVYDPCTGTATAMCVPTNVTALVRQVARRLGYD